MEHKLDWWILKISLVLRILGWGTLIVGTLAIFGEGGEVHVAADTLARGMIPPALLIVGMAALVVELALRTKQAVLASALASGLPALVDVFIAVAVGFIAVDGAGTGWVVAAMLAWVAFSLIVAWRGVRLWRRLDDARLDDARDLNSNAPLRVAMAAASLVVGALMMPMCWHVLLGQAFGG